MFPQVGGPFPIVWAGRPSGGDDHAALQRQVDALGTGGGGTLELERGVYQLSRSLVLKSGVTIQGRGKATTTIQALPVETLVIGPLFIHSVSDVRVNALTVDGRKQDYAPVTEQRHGILVMNSIGVTFDDVRSTNNKGDGLYVGGGSAALSQRVRVMGGDFDLNHRNNCSITAARNVKFYGTRFNGASGTAPTAGVDIEPNFDTDIIDDIQFYGCESSGNIAEGYLVYLRAAPTAPQGNIGFYGCVSSGNGSDYWLKDANNVRILGGAVADPENGILMTGTVRDVHADFGRFSEFGEVVADPSAPAANRGRLFMRDNGAGKTQLCVRFATGAVQVVATEP